MAYASTALATLIMTTSRAMLVRVPITMTVSIIVFVCELVLLLLLWLSVLSLTPDALTPEPVDLSEMLSSLCPGFAVIDVWDRQFLAGMYRSSSNHRQAVRSSLVHQTLGHIGRWFGAYEIFG